MSARDRLTGPSNTGVWYFTDAMSAGQAGDAAGRIESLGYSTLWLPDTMGRDPFAHIAWLGSQTSTLQFATGIASIFHRHPGPMQQAANTLAEQTGGRFVLGLGVSHGPMVEGIRKLDYSKPLSQMRDYLAAMDASMYMAIPPADKPLRLLAALGPKMLELSATAADGAHPYFVTPEHTAEARAAIGPDKLLCVEQKVHRVDRCRRRPCRRQHPDRSVRRSAQLPQQLEADRIHRGRDRAAVDTDSSTTSSCGATPTTCAPASRPITTRGPTTCASSPSRPRARSFSTGTRSKRSHRRHERLAARPLRPTRRTGGEDHTRTRRDGQRTELPHDLRGERGVRRRGARRRRPLHRARRRRRPLLVRPRSE